MLRTPHISLKRAREYRLLTAKKFVFRESSAITSLQDSSKHPVTLRRDSKLRTVTKRVFANAKFYLKNFAQFGGVMIYGDSMSSCSAKFQLHFKDQQISCQRDGRKCIFEISFELAELFSTDEENTDFIYLRSAPNF